MSEIEAALDAWLDAPSGDTATNHRLAEAIAAVLTPEEHWIVAIRPGGFLGNEAGIRLGYRARCRCRWVSGYYRSPDAARLAGSEHIAGASNAGR